MGSEYGPLVLRLVTRDERTRTRMFGTRVFVRVRRTRPNTEHAFYKIYRTRTNTDHQLKKIIEHERTQNTVTKFGRSKFTFCFFSLDI